MNQLLVERKKYTVSYFSTNIVKDDSLLSRIERVAEKNTDARAKEFINSLLEFCKLNQGLTRNQLEYFEKIESHFSPQATLQAQEWAKEYTQEKRELLKLCAEYYQHTNYDFDGIIRRILSEPDFIPTENQFQRITMNKYAQKVITATKADPKYPKDSLVQIRKESKLPGNLLGKFAYVIKPNSSPVQNATKGAKRYQILPFGSTKTIEVEERHLKWGKNTKKNTQGDTVSEGEHSI